MRHIKKCYLLLGAVFLLGCQKTENGENDQLPALYEPPKTVKVNLDEPFVLNQYTGDSIGSVINSNGEEVVFGQEIKLSLSPIDPASYKPPTVVPIDTSNYVYLEDRNYFRHSDVDYTALPADSVKVKKISDPTRDFILINAIGDTIETGVKRKISPDVVTSPLPEYTTGFPPKLIEKADLSVKNISLDQGLKSSRVTNVDIDQNGLLWITTLGFGVCSYDGHGFRYYDISNGLRENWLLDVMCDSEGRLWLVSDGGGICQIEGEKVSRYSVEEGLGSKSYFHIFEDSEGTIWMASVEAGLISLDVDNNVCHYTTNEGLPSNTVLRINEDENKTLWIGTTAGLTKFDGETFTTYDQSCGLVGNYVWGIVFDEEGDMWISTGDALNRFDGEGFYHYGTNEGMSIGECCEVLIDQNKNIWIPHVLGGLDRICTTNDPDKFYIKNYGLENGLTAESLWSLFLNDDDIWVSTLGHGEDVISLNSFNHLDVHNGLRNNKVTSIVQTPNGQIWLGTLGNGIEVIDGNKKIEIGGTDQPTGIFCRQLALDKNNNMWWSADSEGLNYFEKDHVKIYTRENGLGGEVITSVLVDQNNKIWAGSLGGGITLIDQGKFYHLKEKDGLAGNFVICLFEDSKGNIWIGTRSGISKYDGNTIFNFGMEQGLPDLSVSDIIEDHEGKMWFATDEGIGIYHNDEMTYIGMDQGLQEHKVLSLVEDHQNRIWAGVDEGLYCIIQKEDTYKIHSFFTEDGLKSDEFHTNSCMVDASGRGWWGTLQGVAILDLNNLEFATKSPEVKLMSLSINDANYDFPSFTGSDTAGIYFEGWDSQYLYPKNLKLEHHQNHLTFYFNAIDWSAPHKIQYTYKLKGLGEEWSVPSTEIKADYRGLSYGEYTFQVAAIGASQEWSKPFEYHFEILPPWWHTWWARILYALLLGGIIWGYIRWRTAKFKKNEERLKYEIAMATIEIRDQKEEVEKQKEIVEESHKEIKDSITYAKRLQDAILPTTAMLNQYLPNNFIFFKPKDVVSGDFYWFEHSHDISFVAAADCTGHGVPGALVSVVCSNALNQAVNEFGLVEP